MSNRHAWEVDTSTGQSVWVCKHCHTATNNAFMASLPRECVVIKKEPVVTLDTMVDLFISSALEEIGHSNFLVLPEHRQQHLRSIMLWIVDNRWTAFAERKPESGVYLVYYPAIVHDSCPYSEHVGTAFYDADEDVCRGEYHGPVRATHWRRVPQGPVL